MKNKGLDGVKISLCNSCNCMTKTIRHFCGKCGKAKGYLVGGMPQKIKPDLNDFIEDIKELKGTDVGIGTVFGAEGEKINQLIRNQNRIINELTYLKLNEKL